MSNSTITTPPTSSLTSSSTTDVTTSSTSSITSTSDTSSFTSSIPPADTFTSLITVSPTASNQKPSVVVITSTASARTSNDLAASASASRAASSSRAAALATAGANSANKGGLSSGGRIAIAVVVPIVGIAAIVAALIFFWKKRKARKNAEEERRKEVEEYGYNPNNDPTLPAVGSTYGETNSEMAEDNSGYRGWGATSTQRKPSTTLGSSRAQVGMAVSDTTSNTGQYNSQPSEGNSGDPLINSSGRERGMPDDSEHVGALGGAPATTGAAQNRDLNRGPSNASSAYTGHRSEGSGDGDRIGGYAPQQYYEDVGYYNDAQPNHGPYGDGTYGGGQGQPVIRDVQARRNTRIEKPSVFPQQGNSGISQNF